MLLGTIAQNVLLNMLIGPGVLRAGAGTTRTSQVY